MSQPGVAAPTARAADPGATPQARPRRLAPRYPMQARVRVRLSSGEEREYDARDISKGGLFVATDASLEIFTDIELCLPMPNAAELRVPARVVHIMSPQKAEAIGIPAGMGLQFEGLNPAQTARVEQLVAAARDMDPRPRIPRLIAGADVGLASSDPLLSYVLSHVDGRRGPEVLAESLALELDAVDNMLRELLRLSVIELVPASPNSLPPSAAKPVAKPAPRPAAAPAPAAVLDPATSARLESLLAVLSDADHYTMLGVPQTASRELIRSTFFTLSKTFHPDAYFGKSLGDDLGKLERVFARMSEAYGVLSKQVSREEYDAYLAQARSLADDEAAAASASSEPMERAVVVRPALPARLPTPSNDVARPEPRAVAPVAPLRQVAAAAATVERVSRVTPAAASPAAPVTAVASKPESNERRTEALRALQRTLGGRGESAAQRQLSLAERCIVDAETAQREGRIPEAVKQVQLLRAMQIEDDALKARAERVRILVMRSLAMDFEKQAIYEERHQKWAQAAASWLKVCDGRPGDANPHRRAALALVEARGDLRRAVVLAKQAVELAPSDAQNRRALGHIYIASGMKLNARRELEAAIALSHADAATVQVLKTLAQ